MKIFAPTNPALTYDAPIALFFMRRNLLVVLINYDSIEYHEIQLQPQTNRLPF